MELQCIWQSRTVAPCDYCPRGCQYRSLCSNWSVIRARVQLWCVLEMTETTGDWIGIMQHFTNNTRLTNRSRNDTCTSSGAPGSSTTSTWAQAWRSLSRTDHQTAWSGLFRCRGSGGGFAVYVGHGTGVLIPFERENGCTVQILSNTRIQNGDCHWEAFSRILTRPWNL